MHLLEKPFLSLLIKLLKVIQIIFDSKFNFINKQQNYNIKIMHASNRYQTKIYEQTKKILCAFHKTEFLTNFCMDSNISLIKKHV